MLDADRMMTIFAWLDRKPIAAGVLMMLALFLACSVSASPYLLAYDLLPLTFAAIALLACASLDGLGRRVVQLVSGPRLAARAWHLLPARSGIDRAGLRGLSVNEVAHSGQAPGWPENGHYLSRARVFEGEGCASVLAGHTPSPI
jgi:hypothetical protein